MPIRKIIVPDYYNEFKCKCGACRSSCCMGWRVTISYAEYCRLLGAQCKKDIRSKLDCALIPLSNATKERYAEIKHNYLGLCSMYRSDGLCSLHASCGEESLPAICRLYPRSLFMDGLDTGACANSCEAVVELLLNKQEPISFTEIQLYTTTEILPQTDNQELLLDLERKTILLLSDRSLPLDERLLTVGRLLSKYATVPTQTNNLATPTDKQNNIEFIFSLATVMSEYSDAFRVLYSSLIKRAGIDEGNFTKELSICKPQLLANFPDYERYLEQLLNNHLLYERFPYSILNNNIWKEYVSLCGVYTILKLLTSILCCRTTNKDDLVDLISALFRSLEHSNACEILASHLCNHGKSDINSLYELYHLIN